MSSASSHRERANLAALNPNPLAASNRHNGKTKQWGTTKSGNPKKSRVTTSSNSSNGTRTIVCFGCNKPGHKKSECPERKEGNTANAGAARGRPVAIATQEIHYASMAQVVEPSLQGSSVTWDSKKLHSIVVFQALVVPSAWMTNYHRQHQGGARQGLNLIKVSVPAVISSGPPVFTSHVMSLHNFHRDIVSEFIMDTQAVVSNFVLKTWAFLLYPDRSGDHVSDFDVLLQQILKLGILPLAQHYFQSYFSPRGPAHQVYCRRFLDFAKAQLQDFARSWRLMECLIGIRVDRMRVEVLFCPVGRFPWQWEVMELSNIDVCPMYGPFEQRHNGPTADFFLRF
jgi:hypothetical protein